MSEYHAVKVIYNDESCLVQSIKDMGFKAEIHKQGVLLNNSYSTAKAKSHVVVRKGQFNGCGDIGFEKTKKGYVMHADNYDYGYRKGKFRVDELNKKYVENRIKKYVGTNSNCNVSSRRENDKGQIEIHLRVRS